MKLLVLNYEYPPLGGGAANATWHLLREFSHSEELEIHLVTSSTGRMYRENPYPNVTIHFLDIGKSKNVHYQSLLELLIYSWRSFFYVKHLRNSGILFDVVHAFFGVPSGFIAMFLGLPFIVSLRGSDVPFYNRRFLLLDTIFFRWLSKKIWGKAKFVIANSEGLRLLANKSVPGQRIEVVGNGVDTSFFRQKSRHVGHNKLVILSTGRLILRKGYDLLIKAVHGLRHVKLIIVGDGPERDALAQLAETLNVECELTGAVEHSNIPEMLLRGDVFVLPSLNEGMSNSVLEAMACGLPIIMTDVGGSEELIDGNGLVVGRGNILELRAAIEWYRYHPWDIDIHGKRSLSIVQNLDWKMVAQRYTEYYVASI